MTLNGVTAHILRFFTEFDIALQVAYIAVVKDRPIMSVNIVSQFQSSTFSQN